MGAVPVEDIEFPESEVGILRPLMRHDAQLRDTRDGPCIDQEVGQEVTRGIREFLAPCLVVVK
jgi:hypothetical protein